MAKVLRLTFNTSLGKKRTLSVHNPILPIDPATVKTAMETLINENVFGFGPGDDFVSIHSADLYERVVDEIELPV